VTDEPKAGEPREASRVRTFLIADIRGYTRFSQEHGDEAASALARGFATVVRKTVPEHGGELLELRGDEALCIFESARGALRAAVELQRRLRDPADGEPAFPLGVGIGLDAGEAVPTEGGYRGRALNIAARLCSLARPGQILASETVTSLAGHQEGARLVPQRPTRVKGVEVPIRPVEVIPEIDLPPVPSSPRPRPSRRRRLLLLPIAFGAVGLITAAVVFSRGDSARVVSANSLAVIDPSTNRVVDEVAVGDGPARVAVGDGQVWVLNERAQTISLVDAEARSVRKTFAVGVTPADITLGLERVWIADRHASAALELNSETGTVLKRIEVDNQTGDTGVDNPDVAGGSRLAFGLGNLWLLHSGSLSRVDPETGKELERIALSGLSFYHVAVGEGSVWVDACCDGNMRVDPESGTVEYMEAHGQGPIAFGFGSVWIADALIGDSVWRINPATNVAVGAVGCGKNSLALDVATGDRSVWVACSGGTVLRVDGHTGELLATIDLGGTPAGIAVGEGAVWVTVG
jgi:YVTN family beta-propeller protein